MVDADCLLLSGLIICLCISFTLLPQLFFDESNGSKTSLRNGMQAFISISKSHNLQSDRVNHEPYIPYKYTPRKLNEMEMPEIVCSNGQVGVMNDDYCDCLDGEDEPNTSACSHILAGKFVFACDKSMVWKDGTQQSIERKIYTSRISDGILDCRDKSDE